MVCVGVGKREASLLASVCVLSNDDGCARRPTRERVQRQSEAGNRKQVAFGPCFKTRISPHTHA